MHDKKIEQNNAQYNLDRQTAKIYTLSLWNINKYGFLTGRVVSPEKDFQEKAVAFKTFEYAPSVKELKAQTRLFGLYQKLYFWVWWQRRKTSNNKKRRTGRPRNNSQTKNNL